MKINWARTVFICVLMSAALYLFLFHILPAGDKPVEIPISQVISMIQENKVSKIVVEGDTLTITDNTGIQYKSYKETGISITAYGIDPTVVDVVQIDSASGFNWGILLYYAVPMLLLVGLFFFIMSQARNANNQAISFGRSRARLFSQDKPNVTFADVAGVEEAKQDLCEVVEFLKSREKFHALGARIPKGVLLIGPPGTGKTLMARAVAGEAGTPFFSISGSEFVEMFVGVGASRVRDLFGQAKRNAPCIVFIDEIDAVGRQRGAGLGGGHDEREQTLNQILVEMDGFDTNTSVIVMAATNRPDILDPALLRPGRFDRRVVLDAPDVSGRAAILKVHTKGKPLDENVNLEVIAKLTAGFSGADLANLVNEAAILAARRNKKIIGMPELEESIDRVLLGPERKSRRMTDEEKRLGAYHEAGHALIGHIAKHLEPVRKVSIIPRGMAGGYTKSLQEDKKYLTLSYLKDELAMFLGGRSAEELVFGEISTGASSDIKQATDFARRMVVSWGMSKELGPRTFGQKDEMIFLGREISEQRDYGATVADQIDAEVNRIIQEAYQTALRLLTENRAKLEQIAQALLAKETLEGDELDAVLNEPPAEPSSGEVAVPAVAKTEEKPKEHTKREASPSLPDIVMPKPRQAPQAW